MDKINEDEIESNETTEKEIEEEYSDMEDKTPEGIQEIEIKNPEQIKKPTNEKDYTEFIESNEQVKTYLEYQRLKKKVENKQELTEEEKKFITSVEETQRMENETKAHEEQVLKEEAERQKALEEEIQRAYQEEKETHPEKIMKVNVKDISLTGGDSIIKLLGFIKAMKTAKKKGGKVLVQVFRNRRVLFKWTMNDVSFVEFYSKDEKGNDLLEVTRFSEYLYSFEGSPIPVLFAIQGYAEGFDFFSEFRKDLTAELLSRISTRSFITGYMKGAEIRNPKEKKSGLEGLMPFMPIILILGLLIMGAMLYQMYGEMQVMKTTLSAMSSTIQNMSVNVPMVLK